MHIKARSCLTALLLATIFSDGAACRAQEGPADVERATQQAMLQRQAENEALDRTLKARDFAAYVRVFNHSEGEWDAELDKVALLPPKDQARLLVELWHNGMIQCEDLGFSTMNAERAVTQYHLQDRLMKLSYQLLGEAPPKLPTKRRSFVTVKETQDLAARLLALP